MEIPILPELNEDEIQNIEALGIATQPEFRVTKYNEFKKIYKEYPTEEWNLIFEQIKSTQDKEIYVKVFYFYPVFVWDKEDKKEIKYSTETKKKYNIVSTGRITVTPVYEGSDVLCAFTFKITECDELWQKIKGVDYPSVGTKRRAKTEQEHRKRHRANEKHTSLIERVGENGIEKRLILRYKGRGICTFKDGDSNENIVVVDGNGIDVYDKDLTYLGTISRNIENSPSGISYPGTGNDLLVAKEEDYSIINFLDRFRTKTKKWNRNYSDKSNSYAQSSLYFDTRQFGMQLGYNG